MRLAGVYDMHVHASPCVDSRRQDAGTILAEASAAGMAGLVFKSPHVDTASLAGALDGDGTRAFGGVVLNHGVGGINPYAVEATLSMKTTDGRRLGRVVWLPTRHSEDHIKRYGPATVPSVTLWRDGTDEPTPELIEVFALVSDYDAVLATGHLGYAQVDRVVDLARAAGVQKILCTHVEIGPVTLTVDEQLDLAKRGVFLEHCFAGALIGEATDDPRLRTRHGATLETTVDLIRQTGVDQCVLSTDLGASVLPNPVSGLSGFLDQLETLGLTQNELSTMVSTNPAQLLGASA